MRACIQRVSQASVTVAGEITGRIECGLLVLLGVASGDTDDDAHQLAQKIVELRIFNDNDGKMNRSLLDTGGAVLVVSQFTLLGDCRKGRRPSFTEAAPPNEAQRLYEKFVSAVAGQGVRVETGRFREHMLTPLVRIVILAVGWALRRDFRFALVALTVLLLLIASLFIGVDENSQGRANRQAHRASLNATIPR